MEINFIYLICTSYFVGSIPFAYILPKILGYGDIRNIGSGNVGATNVLRAGSKTLAILVLFLDVIKGFLPLTFLLLYNQLNIELYEIICIGSFTIIGHIFPIWLRFKGGKGVATYLGFILAVNYLLAIIFIIAWLFIALLKKYSSLASVGSLIIIPSISFFIIDNLKINIVLILLSILITFKHKGNIKRLLNNSEDKIKL